LEFILKIILIIIGIIVLAVVFGGNSSNMNDDKDNSYFNPDDPMGYLDDKDE
jgi:uncharacterized membrane protein